METSFLFSFPPSRNLNTPCAFWSPLLPYEVPQGSVRSGLYKYKVEVISKVTGSVQWSSDLYFPVDRVTRGVPGVYPRLPVSLKILAPYDVFWGPENVLVPSPTFPQRYDWFYLKDGRTTIHLSFTLQIE